MYINLLNLKIKIDMSIRKMKKGIKHNLVDKDMRNALKHLKKIKVWSKIDSPNSKFNMKILTANFFRNGHFH